MGCGSSASPPTAASNARWPETPCLPQPGPDTWRLRCVWGGTSGREGAVGQEDDTRPEVTGSDVGNGLAADATSDAPADLPAQVFLRTDTETFNRRYQFALRDGEVWFKSNTAVTGIGQPWAAVPMPACLAGSLIGISADADEKIGRASWRGRGCQ